MNTHDKYELPPLPPLHIVPSVEPVDYPDVAQVLMDYARAAIDAYRQCRGDLDEERLAMEAVMESVDPATWPGLTLAQRCALGRFAKPQPLSESDIPAEPVKHDLYKTGDPDAPEQILDRNGVVVLQCCKRCGKAEAELSGPCEPVKVDAEASVPSDSEIMWEWANTKNTGDMRIDLVAFARALLARYRNT